jgi:hypothetical protein
MISEGRLHLLDHRKIAELNTPFRIWLAVLSMFMASIFKIHGYTLIDEGVIIGNSNRSYNFLPLSDTKIITF